MGAIESRKQHHLDLCVDGDVGYRKSAGFDRYDFVHQALPELDFDEISLASSLLGRTFSAPLMISSMTGGMEKGASINASLARAAHRFDLPLGLGSQRAMIEKPALGKTFMAAREAAPDIFLAANIGGVQLRDPAYIPGVLQMAAAVQANAIIVHLNPLQELMQPEGDRQFKGVLEGITRLTGSTALPVVVKETGAGLSAETAARLLHAGVRALDIAGAGGTSWSAVEMERTGFSATHPAAFLRDWGIPTVDSLRALVPLRGPYSFDLIASGGVYSPADVVKALALGAGFTAVARPVIQVLLTSGENALMEWLEAFTGALKKALLLLGVSSPAGLTPRHLTHIA